MFSCYSLQVSLELIDRCLATEPSQLIVTVVAIGRIAVRVPDRVQHTRSIEAIVQLFDSAEQPMLLDRNRNPLQQYDLHVSVQSAALLDVQLHPLQTDLGVGEIRYGSGAYD